MLQILRLAVAMANRAIFRKWPYDTSMSSVVKL